jgi:hypothetical protein
MTASRHDPPVLRDLLSPCGLADKLSALSGQGDPATTQLV